MKLRRKKAKIKMTQEDGCPVCLSDNVKLTRCGVVDTELNMGFVRLYCPDCKRGITITGIIISTGKKVRR